MILVISLLLIFITGVGGYILFGFYSLIIPMLIIIFLIFIRLQCSEDSRAVEWLLWDIKGWINRLKCRSDITSITSSIDHLDNQYQEKKIREWIKNNTASKKDP